MAGRYDNRTIAMNDSEVYKEILETRGLQRARQYTTPTFRYPTAAEMLNFQTIGHMWNYGDRYYKLADRYYNNPELWWVIAFFNQKPLEHHVSLGEVIKIPVPLDAVLTYMVY